MSKRCYYLAAHRRIVNALTINNSRLIFAVLVVWCSYLKMLLLYTAIAHASGYVTGELGVKYSYIFGLPTQWLKWKIWGEGTPLSPWAPCHEGRAHQMLTRVYIWCHICLSFLNRYLCFINVAYHLPFLCIFTNLEVQERYMPIIRSAGTPFPCVPRQFNHCRDHYWMMNVSAVDRASLQVSLTDQR